MMMNNPIGGMPGMNMGMPGMNIGGMPGMNMGMPGMNIGGMPGMNIGGMPGMGNMGMPGMNMGMPGMNMGMPGMGNMGMPGMNMGMPGMNMGMPGMGNMADIGKVAGVDDPQGWNLVFENQNDLNSIIVTISEQKTVKEAISKYRIKANRTDPCKFVFNSKQLYPEMRICESGLKDKSKILVISLQNLKGAYL